jgi:hypothetical protein
VSGIPVAGSLLATIFGDIDRLDCKYLVEHGRIANLDQRDAEWWTSVVLACYPDSTHPAVGYEVESLLLDSGGDAMELLMQVAEKGSRHPNAALTAARVPLALFGRNTDPTPEVFDGEPVADSHLHSGGSMPLRVFLSGLATRPDPVGLESKPRRPALDSADPLATEAPRRDRIVFISGSGLEWDAMVLLAAVRWSLRLLWFSADSGDLGNRAQLEARKLEADLVDLVREGAFWSKVKRAAVSRGEESDLARRLNRPFYDDGVCPSLRDLISFWQRGGNPTSSRRQQFAVGLIRAVVAVSALATSLPGEGLGRFSNRFRLMGKVQQAVFGSRSSESVDEWKRKFLVETIAEIAPTPQVVAAEFRRTFKASTKSDFKAEVLRDLAIHNAAFAAFCEEEHSMALTMPVGFGRRGSQNRDSPGGLDELRHVVAGCDALISIAQEDQGSELMRAIWSIDVAGTEIGSSNWPFQIGAQLLEEAGVDLLFTIHAGESFTSELNGIRRVGELFLGAVRPKRIGHALSLSKEAAQAVLSHGKSPISRVEAIMDLAWLHCAIGSQEALLILEDLTPRWFPRPGIGAETWVAAFEALHDLGAVGRLLIGANADQRKVPNCAKLIEEMESASALELAIGALAAGVPAAVVGCDVMAPLSAHEVGLYEGVVARESEAAREHVLGLVRSGGVTIESCPSSNVTLAGLPGYATHPLWEWSEASEPVDVSISSDDPLHFGNNVLRELNALIATGRDPQSIRKAIDAGLRDCSGGSEKQLEGPRGYKKIVELVEDPSVAV